MRVVIADDSRLLREGIASFVRGEGIEVVGEAADADELLAKVDEHVPDVAIIDIRMPPTQTDEGIQAAHHIRRRHPQTAIVLLSQHVEVGVATQLLAEVLELVAQGRSNKAIGEQLEISRGAVQQHVSTIFNKLGLPAGEEDDRRVLAVLAYLRPAS